MLINYIKVGTFGGGGGALIFFTFFFKNCQKRIMNLTNTCHIISYHFIHQCSEQVQKLLKVGRYLQIIIRYGEFRCNLI